MTFQKCSFGKKLVTMATSVALVASMAVVAPVAAYATYDEGSITVSQASIAVTAGDSKSLVEYFTPAASGGDGQHHVDYKITATSGTDASGIKVVKHSGVITVPAGTSEDAWVTVTAYLTPIAQPSQVNSNPCEATDVSANITVYVNAAASGTYGAQGIGGNTIEMVSPSVTSASGNNTDGYVNQLGRLAATSKTLSFTYKQSAGINNTTVSKYVNLNGSKITVTSSTGATVATLSTSGALTIPADGIDASRGTVTLNLDTSNMTAGQQYDLNFSSGVCGNNESKTLGIPVQFHFIYLG